MEYGIHSWDMAAILPIVEEAGGRFTDWNGVRTVHHEHAVTSNGKLHDETLQILHGRKRA